MSHSRTSPPLPIDEQHSFSRLPLILAASVASLIVLVSTALALWLSTRDRKTGELASSPDSPAQIAKPLVDPQLAEQTKRWKESTARFVEHARVCVTFLKSQNASKPTGAAVKESSQLIDQLTKLYTAIPAAPKSEPQLQNNATHLDGAYDCLKLSADFYARISRLRELQGMSERDAQHTESTIEISATTYDKQLKLAERFLDLFDKNVHEETK